MVGLRSLRDLVPPYGLAGQSHPADIVFLAMTHHHLGHADEARTLLARLRDLLQQDPWKADPEIPPLLHEAEQLIDPPQENCKIGGNCLPVAEFVRIRAFRPATEVSRLRLP